MCIIFLYSDPTCQQNGYKLIIASNRDEYFQRPTKEAAFIPDNPQVLCGTDLEEGVEGGTWLGVTKTGRFAFLTNYLTPEAHVVAKEKGASRGTIVKDYLYSHIPVADYIQQNLVGQDFRPFSFIGGKLLTSNNAVDMHYYSNHDETSPYKLENGSYTLACTSMGKQWKKVKLGSKIFASAIKNPDQYPSKLTDFLLSNVLSNSVELYPDPMIFEQGGSKFSIAKLRSYCSIMITGLPNYGTRSQTVVLVDANNHLFYTENSMTKDGSGKELWKRSSFDFLLDL